MVIAIGPAGLCNAVDKGKGRCPEQASEKLCSEERGDLEQVEQRDQEGPERVGVALNALPAGIGHESFALNQVPGEGEGDGCIFNKEGREGHIVQQKSGHDQQQDACMQSFSRALVEPPVREAFFHGSPLLTPVPHLRRKRGSFGFTDRRWRLRLRAIRCRLLRLSVSRSSGNSWVFRPPSCSCKRAARLALWSAGCSARCSASRRQQRRPASRTRWLARASSASWMRTRLSASSSVSIQ